MMSFLYKNNERRNKTLPVRGKTLDTPIYFPSISSIKTNLNPLAYFKILRALNYPNFLVSAYDVFNSHSIQEFTEALKSNQSEGGPIILMDSGNYESWWLRDKTWDISTFNKVIEDNVADLAFCFDNQLPSDSIIENVEAIKSSTQQTQAIALRTSIIPIAHCSKEKLNETVANVCNELNCSIVSIPERILGNGILERIATITSLRKELNKRENYVYIHVLGTGNPFSLLLLSFAGADSFDGLEWCQTTVDSTTALLYHFQQKELIEDKCQFCANSELDYTMATLGHNLVFYQDWLSTIQSSIGNNTENELLERYFTKEFIGSLNQIWK